MYNNNGGEANYKFSGITMTLNKTRGNLFFSAYMYSSFPERYNWYPEEYKCQEVEVFCHKCGCVYQVKDLPTRCVCGIDVDWSCPWVGCRHNRYIDVTANGSIVFRYPDKEVDEVKNLCSLRVTKDHTLEEIGSTSSMRRERVRQIEVGALRKLRNISDAYHLHEYKDYSSTTSHYLNGDRTEYVSSNPLSTKHGKKGDS